MIKKLFLIIGGILLVLVGLVAFLLWRLDPEELGQEVIRRVNEKGGMQLQADTFSIKPLQGIFIDNAHLEGDAPAGSISADVGNVAIEYELLPILQKQLVINRIVIEQPRAELVSKPAAGPPGEPQASPSQTTSEEGVAQEAPADATAADEGGFKPSLAIDEVRIENASLAVKTEGGDGSDLAISGLTLQLNDFFVDSAVSQPLMGLTARGSMQLDQIELDGKTIQGGRGTMGIHDGQVAIKDLGVETPNASLNVSAIDLDLRQEPPSYHLEAGGSFDLDSFVNAEGSGGFGPAAVSISLDGVGPDPADARGGGALRMEAGTIPAFPMVAKIERILGKPLITGTAYEVTDMNFTLADGVARIEPFGLVMQNLQITGGGTVSLAGPLNLRLDIKLPRELVDIGILDGMVDAMTDPEGWTTIPFRVEGTTGDPDVDIDMTVAKEYAKGAAKNVVDKAVDSAVDAVKDKTRKLLKRDKD